MWNILAYFSSPDLPPKVLIFFIFLAQFLKAKNFNRPVIVMQPNKISSILSYECD